MKKEKKEEVQASRTRSIFLFYVVLGKKNLNKLVQECGPLVRSVREQDGKYEICTLRKNAEKVLEMVEQFYYDNSIREFTKSGQVKFFTPFGNIFSPKKLYRMGFSKVPGGVVLLDSAQRYKESLEPVIPPEKKSFIAWDKQIDKILSVFEEKRQIKARKWLELTVPNLKHSGV